MIDLLELEPKEEDILSIFDKLRASKNLPQKEYSDLIVSSIKDLSSRLAFYHMIFVNNIDFVKNMIEEFDSYILEDQYLHVLFSILDQEYFKKYILKHYESLKAQVSQTIFLFHDSISETDDFFLLPSYVGKKVGKKLFFIPIFNYSQIGYLFYQVFQDDLELVRDYRLLHQVGYSFNSLFKYMDFDHLYFFFSKAFKQKDECIFIMLSSLCNSKNINQFLYCMNRDEFFYFINTKKDFCFDLLASENDYKAIFWEKIRESVRGISTKLEEKATVYSLSYFEVLNYLDTLSKEEQKKSPLYLQAFQIFQQEFLLHYQDSLEGDISVLSLLFNRIIKKKSNIFEVLCLPNKRSLYFYFKTNEFFPIKNIILSLNDILNFSVKQYNQLKETYCQDHEDIGFKINREEQKKGEQILSLLKIFHYDFLKKISSFVSLFSLYQFICSNMNEIRFDDEKYMWKMETILLEEQSFLIDSSSFLKVFNYLYDAKYSKLTCSNIKKRMKSISYLLFPNNYLLEPELLKLDFVSKGDPFLEKVNALSLYEQYRFRIFSSIPNIHEKFGNFCYEMVPMDSPTILSNGIGKYRYGLEIGSSCLTPNGKASTCLYHGAINENGRFFKVSYLNKMLAYSWVWRCGEILCFDNIEVTDLSFQVPDCEKMLFDIYQKAATSLLTMTSEGEKEHSLKLIILGRNPKDVANSYFDGLKKVNDYTLNLFQPNHSENLYLEDSKVSQVILAGQYQPNLFTEDVQPYYLIERDPVEKIESLDKQEQEEILNSIYFDYCMEQNQKYEYQKKHYVKGYYNKDWFMGVLPNGKKDFFYRGKDQRMLEEASLYYDAVPHNFGSIFIPKIENELNYLLDDSHYEIDEKNMKSYFAVDHHDFPILEEFYFHSFHSLSLLPKILAEGKITSSFYGKHHGRGGTNGIHFISIAKCLSFIYFCYYKNPGFLFNNNLCAFSAKNDYPVFQNATYPIRGGHNGEYQVRDFIDLNKAKALTFFGEDYLTIAKMIRLLEYYGYDLPLVNLANNQEVDQKILKKYIHFK